MNEGHSKMGKLMLKNACSIFCIPMNVEGAVLSGGKGHAENSFFWRHIACEQEKIDTLD